MSATQCVIRIEVANPIPGGDVTILYTAQGVGSITPGSGQVLAAANVTNDLETTGHIDFTVDRPPYASPPGRVTFTSTSPERLPDTDSVDVAPMDEPWRCFLSMASNQGIPGSTWTAVAWDAEPVDIGNLHSNSVNPSRITIPAGGNRGLWTFNAQALFTNPFGGGTPPTLVALDLYKNGASVLPAPVGRTWTNTMADHLALTKMIAAPSVGDYFEVFAFHNGVGGSWGLDLCSFEVVHTLGAT